jgi:hypothetical protein
MLVPHVGDLGPKVFKHHVYYLMGPICVLILRCSWSCSLPSPCLCFWSQSDS